MRFGELVELVEFCLQKPLVGQLRFVFGHQGGRHASTQGVFDDFMILRGTQQYADRRLLVRFLNVPVERFQIELQLAEIFGLELVDFQLDGHQTIERPIEKEQVEREIASADLQGVLASDKTEVAAQFNEELFVLFDQATL